MRKLAEEFFETKNDPTQTSINERSIEKLKNIHEQELLENTPVGGRYDALYLCSALVLPEHRGKGMAERLVTGAVRSIIGLSALKERNWPPQARVKLAFRSTEDLSEFIRSFSSGSGLLNRGSYESGGTVGFIPMTKDKSSSVEGITSLD